MANCPSCGSDHIQLKRETDVNWGRAIVGLAVFGVVGGAVGAVTGEDRNVNACLDCGTSWKAKDLYELLQLIKKLTGIKLDLSKEEHRIFLDDFMSEFSADLEFIANIEKEGQKRIQKIEAQVDEHFKNGCVAGCGVMVFVPVIAAGVGANALIVIMIIIAILFVPPLIGVISGKLAQIGIESQIESAKKETMAKRIAADKKLKAKVVAFANSHPLIEPD
uniref:Uncharacterized protein n=1 Tax=Cyanothece sp. (strain PCC 7425 / ATCC 29141) TaxID=395961 RepID=B8HYG7_CYAP4